MLSKNIPIEMLTQMTRTEMKARFCIFAKMDNPEGFEDDKIINRDSYFKTKEAKIAYFNHNKKKIAEKEKIRKKLKDQKSKLK